MNATNFIVLMIRTIFVKVLVSLCKKIQIKFLLDKVSIILKKFWLTHSLSDRFYNKLATDSLWKLQR